MNTPKHMSKRQPPDTQTERSEAQPLQLSLSFSDPDSTQSISQGLEQTTEPRTRRNKITKVIRAGNPAIPVGVTKYGTHVAKLDHIWRAARIYARQNNYKLLETYGVIGVAPFSEDKVAVWLTYLNVPYRPPVEVYQLYDKDLTWIAEWSID